MTHPTPAPALTYIRVKRLAVSAVGLLLGTSAFFSGLYDTTVWSPILLGCLALLLAVVVARPSMPVGPAAFAVGGLGVLWLWSLLSGFWAESSDLAVTDANRWLLYGVLFLLLLFLANDSESRRWLLGATTIGIFITAAYVLFRFLTGDGTDLFVTSRLDGPLGYINGVASYMLVGFWPLVAFAERARHSLARGAAIFAAVQLISVAILTQSRGAIIALIASATLILILVPGRITRTWTLFVIVGGVAVGLPALLDVIYSDGAAPTVDALRSMAEWSLAGGLAAGLIWALATWAVASAKHRSESTTQQMRRASVSIFAVVAVVCLGAVFSHTADRSDQIQKQYDSFTSLQPADSGSRLTSGGGNRYDYWTVALNQFRAHPFEGIGAGNYGSTYYRERKTSEDVQQAHSLELQTLGELGLVGSLGLVAFIGAVLLGFWRTARGCPSRRANPAIAVAAGGTFLVWFFQTSVDWMHLIPGVTGIALCAAVSLMPAARPLGRKVPVGAIVLVAVLAGLAAYPVANQLVALRLQSKASDKLRSDPIGSLEASRDSLSLQPAQRTYFLQSAAFARLGLYEAAHRSLIEATERVPDDFTPWALLGDLAKRRGLNNRADRYYRRAAELNPRDPGLAELSREPRESGG